MNWLRSLLARLTGKKQNGSSSRIDAAGPTRRSVAGSFGDGASDRPEQAGPQAPGDAGGSREGA